MCMCVHMLARSLAKPWLCRRVDNNMIGTNIRSTKKKRRIKERESKREILLPPFISLPICSLVRTQTKTSKTIRTIYLLADAGECIHLATYTHVLNWWLCPRTSYWTHTIHIGAYVFIVNLYNLLFLSCYLWWIDKRSLVIEKINRILDEKWFK
jgi:hypothetical protein